MDLDYQEIGKNIRRYRLLQGLKQKELAERIQVSDQHISYIENAHTQVSLPTLIAIANGLQYITKYHAIEARQSVLHQILKGVTAEMNRRKFELVIEFVQC